MKKKKASFDYRAIYKMLKKYFDFSFKIPHHKKDFTSQQKSAITRKYLKVIPYLDSNWAINKEEVTFLKYPKNSKLPGVDGIRTKSGLIYKWPQAKLAKSKIEQNKWLVVVNPKIKKGAQMVQKRRDIFFPFPKSIRDDILKIQRYVDMLVEKYKPHSIMWSAASKRERVSYDPELFNLYFSSAFDDTPTDKYKRDKMRKKHEDMNDYYNGVFFIYFLN